MSLEDLEPAADDGDDIEAAWIQEAERRLAAYEAGELVVVSAEEVFVEGLRRLRKGR